MVYIALQPSAAAARSATACALGLSLLVLAGCASTGAVPSAQQAREASALAAPAAWLTTLPHGGNTSSLANWWAQLGDPLLPELVTVAQERSASLASARTRIFQARAALTGAQAALGPRLSANASALRGVQAPDAPAATSLSAGLQASWELDLFGGNAAARSASSLRLENSNLGWHEARVSLAADVAATYFNLRNCESVLALTENDARSRKETARLNALTAKAGLNAPANAALANASAADAASGLRAQQAQCSVALKGLVALTGLEEAALNQKLSQKSSQTPSQKADPEFKDKQPAGQQEYAQTALFSIANLPAQVLQQRPDIASAQRNVVAAQQDASAADAQRLPKISLNGSIAGARITTMGQTNSGATWSLGPLAVSLPIFDGGQTAANTRATIAAYDEAVVVLQAKVLQAVREVEEALVNLSSTNERRADVLQAASGYQASLEATQARYRAGLASLAELEESRRIALASQQNQLGLERERIAAWIALYRAAGGGWNGQVDAPVAGTGKTAAGGIGNGNVIGNASPSPSSGLVTSP